ncbi:hypothetical protein [Rhizobium beringeri]|uniref:hypothetical protein n=1 Tax=Rhizobium beringeri TaxID=3019934 RepID=UPI003B5AE6FA
MLANIALSAIEERYERWTYHRKKTQARRKSDGVSAAASARDSDRIAGRCVFLPVRYADDFVVLVSGTLEEAMAEKFRARRLPDRDDWTDVVAGKDEGHSHDRGVEFLGFRFSAIG